MQNDEWLPLQWRPLSGAVVKRLRGVSKIRIKGRPMIAPTEKVGDGASTSRKTVDKCCDKRYCRHN